MIDNPPIIRLVLLRPYDNITREVTIDIGGARLRSGVTLHNKIRLTITKDNKDIITLLEPAEANRIGLSLIAAAHYQNHGEDPIS